MTIQTNTRERIGTIGKIKALAAGLLVAAMMAASIMADAPAHASTTFVVNSQDDQVDTNEFDGVCDADLAAAGNQCTLRAAIQQANRTSGADTINFNIPQGGISLFLTTPMPGITDTVTIDGYTQPTSSRNTLATGTNAVTRVELFGSNLSGGNGLSIEANNSVIRGLTIDDFGSDGIVVKGNGNRIEGSFIGTEPQGPADMGNGQNGVAILSGSNNTIGGTSPAARNNISANDTNGVQISGGGAGNKVLGNLIGTFKDGTSVLGNSGFGVLVIGSTNNAIGDGTAAGANTIAFNGRDGVKYIQFAYSPHLGGGFLEDCEELSHSMQPPDDHEHQSLEEELLGVDDGPSAAARWWRRTRNALDKTDQLDKDTVLSDHGCASESSVPEHTSFSEASRFLASPEEVYYL